MSLTKKWYTVNEATAKFGISDHQLLQWVDEGLIRTEDNKGKAKLLNGYDIEMKLNMVPSV